MWLCMAVMMMMMTKMMIDDSSLLLLLLLNVFDDAPVCRHVKDES